MADAGEAEEEQQNSDPFRKEFDTRVGETALEVREGGQFVVTVTISPKELTVAEHCGLLIPHPEEDSVIYFGPSESHEKLDEIDCCIVTKFTRDQLEDGETLVYDTTSDEYDYEFELEVVES